MSEYEFIATKGSLPKNLDYVKQGYIIAHGEKKAYLKLKKKFNNVLIVRKVKC